ncbi:hypothetical protein VP01_130g7 [Puccinia sorghi]|uniref:Uncharacterized protein n=1 Tax=Puccinia sorghi TaxID=27349 RepID=A0A0L6VN55_9BASI|nr:hypothetical protein VP01_130g7 [Puccinia sorghi]
MIDMGGEICPVTQVLSTQSQPHSPLGGQKAHLPPHSTKVEKAHDQIQSYWFLHSGINNVRDPLDEASIIAIIEFTL